MALASEFKLDPFIVASGFESVEQRRFTRVVPPNEESDGMYALDTSSPAEALVILYVNADMSEGVPI